MVRDGWHLEHVKRHYELYADYARSLRLWLVAYGVGGPVLLANSDTLSQKLIASTEAFVIIAVFLLGVFFQVISALINKWASWYMYAGEVNVTYQGLRAPKIAS
jgi:hypothetical protein